MNNQQDYDLAAQRLADCDYKVLPEGQGYIVRYQQNTQDVSHAHSLTQLLDPADLMEWAKQRRRAPEHLPNGEENG